MVTKTALYPTFSLEQSEKYKKAIISSNVETLEQARAVVLLGVHPNGTEEQLKLYQIQCLFNQAVVKHFYQPGDVILLEDNQELPPGELNKSQIPDLCVSDYQVRGWDNSKCCKQALILKEDYIKVLNAIHVIKQSSQKLKLKEHFDQYQLLFNFVTKHSAEGEVGFKDLKNKVYNHIYFQNPCSLDINFQKERRDFLTTCQKINQSVLQRFVEETFEQRQQSLVECLTQHVENPTANKVFSFIGPNHVHTKGYEKANQALIDTLKKTSYMILDAKRLDSSFFTASKAG